MSETLTGRTRHRLETGSYGQRMLVLQLEVTTETKIFSVDDPTVVMDVIKDVVWRDATIEDLTVESRYPPRMLRSQSGMIVFP